MRWLGEGTKLKRVMVGQRREIGRLKGLRGHDRAVRIRATLVVSASSSCASGLVDAPKRPLRQLPTPGWNTNTGRSAGTEQIEAGGNNDRHANHGKTIWQLIPDDPGDHRAGWKRGVTEPADE